MLSITIHTDRDLTPAGKRSARVVKTTRGSQLRWYVSGRLYHWLAPSDANVNLTNEWLSA
jgi:hypothetical protein